MMEKQTSRKIKMLQVDHVEEYKDQFLRFGQNTGIIHFTISKRGMAKKMKYSLLDMVRYLLSNASLDKTFWVEALEYISHLINSLSSTAIGGKTPLDIWSGGATQDYDLLRVFESPTYFSVKDGKVNP